MAVAYSPSREYTVGGARTARGESAQCACMATFVTADIHTSKCIRTEICGTNRPCTQADAKKWLTLRVSFSVFHMDEKSLGLATKNPAYGMLPSPSPRLELCRERWMAFDV